MRNTLTIKLFAALLISSFLSGCGVLAVGGVVAGASVMADRRTPAVQAIDKGIELEAGNALAKRYGDDAHINVTSFNQKVLLTGEAKDSDIKGQAGAYVKSMKNVRSVFNELAIGPNSTYTARANDAFLESKIKAQMIFTDKLPSNSMAIVVEGGSVYLMGILTQNEAAIAKKLTSNIDGVKDVYAYFDIISDAEKSRLEKQGKADETQPNSAPKQ
ncbi:MULTISPECIES: BON domain-containing protein [unclassified Polynucleobacter]|uniref:BON domain-containing protein n=1 Tax=unclassified Polynucleobacter TaxID=2640945 RepID=UPI000BD1217B|nr:MULTISPECIES: BON domain-containing protein [unclassified Polynucleobacter]OYY18647.1 MAG: transporter [Polynucleobacter sp. 35-46-11]OZA76538.1 MAG: transporter [Polynucleobacter sp. 39-46-10]